MQRWGVGVASSASSAFELCASSVRASRLQPRVEVTQRVRSQYCTTAGGGRGWGLIAIRPHKEVFILQIFSFAWQPLYCQRSGEALMVHHHQPSFLFIKNEKFQAGM